jgi:hypothetical protein
VKDQRVAVDPCSLYRNNGLILNSPYRCVVYRNSGDAVKLRVRSVHRIAQHANTAHAHINDVSSDERAHASRRPRGN